MKFKETEILELKKSTSELKEAIISIVAILNKHQRGKIIFGIKNDGSVIGQNVNEKTLRDVSKSISDYIERKIFPKVKEELIDGKSCVVVEFEGEKIPYCAHGKFYLRVADEDKAISLDELEKLILKNNKDELRWDNKISIANISNIDEEKLKWFLKESGKEFEDVENSLKKLGLIKEDKLLNAGLILFGKNLEGFFRNAKLRCAVFGTEDTNFSIDMKEFEGNLFDLIERAEEYFLQHINIGMKIEGMKRVDIPEINCEAFREAIINAFCHRDYWNDDAVHLAIFSDRVEVRSPGLLFGNLTIEKIKTEKVSERRNELIANMFHMVHFVENWGKGIGKILKLEPETEFEELGRKFYTIFKRKKTPQKTPQKIFLTELENKIFRLIFENNKITRKLISEELNISEGVVKEYIKKLKDKNAIVRIGGRKEGYWEAKK